MFLRLMSLGIPAAGFFAASVLAAQAEPAKSPHESGAKTEASRTAQAGRRIVKLRVVKKGESEGNDESGESLVLEGDDVAGDVEDIVSKAVAEAAKALEDADTEIHVELDGKKLAAKSKEARKALAKARKKLQDMREHMAKRMAKVEVRIDKAAEKAAKDARKAARAAQHRIVILSDGDDGDIRFEKEKGGRTVIIIGGDKVKIVTKEKRMRKNRADTRHE